MKQTKEFKRRYDSPTCLAVSILSEGSLLAASLDPGFDTQDYVIKDDSNNWI